MNSPIKFALLSQLLFLFSLLLSPNLLYGEKEKPQRQRMNPYWNTATAVAWDNDFWLPAGTDRWYTNSLHVSHIRNGFKLFEEYQFNAIHLGAGQFMYTPENLEKSYISNGDRPFSGFAYGMLGEELIRESNFGLGDFSNGIRLKAMAGPAGVRSGAARAQRYMHGQIVKGAEPRGWDNMKSSFFGYNLVGEYTFTSIQMDDERRLRYKLFLNTNLGNIKRNISAGPKFRISIFPTTTTEHLSDQGDTTYGLPVAPEPDNQTSSGTAHRKENQSPINLIFDFGFFGTYEGYNYHLEGRGDTAQYSPKNEFVEYGLYEDYVDENYSTNETDPGLSYLLLARYPDLRYRWLNFYTFRKQFYPSSRGDEKLGSDYLVFKALVEEGHSLKDFEKAFVLANSKSFNEAGDGEKFLYYQFFLGDESRKIAPEAKFFAISLIHEARNEKLETKDLIFFLHYFSNLEAQTKEYSIKPRRTRVEVVGKLTLLLGNFFLSYGYHERSPEFYPGEGIRLRPLVWGTFGFGWSTSNF